ncbi:chemotaxis protein CheW [Oligoflexus tunisiensis]|uniref:chemotaxis protein CheW n=1 Tax=Oligoflexus tunisiensis TaxID=708132 RepID=UPI00159F15CD|nr:chemotaxis protein CheW [Oligoflexus tunisiensis]
MEKNLPTNLQNVPSDTLTLIVRVHTLYCAIPLVNVTEIMRPLPLDRMAGMPAFVRGVSVIRGAATPVVDLRAFLGIPDGSPGRLVTLRVDNRQVALAVDEVLGVQNLNQPTLQNLPPLLHGAAQEHVEAVGRLDAHLLIILRSGWTLSEALFQDLQIQGAGSWR